MSRPEWADWHPPPEHERAALQEEDEQLCHTCERFVTALRIETCPFCGDEE